MKNKNRKRGVRRISFALKASIFATAAAIGVILFPPKAVATYEVPVLLTNANGLEVGSEVSFRGVQIGRVERLDVEEAGVRVILAIDQRDIALTAADRFAVDNATFGKSILRVVDRDGPADELPAPVLSVDPSSEGGV